MSSISGNGSQPTNLPNDGHSTSSTFVPSRTLGLELRKVQPYWYDYSTSVKRRWIGREVLEVYTNEFRDRTKEYYLWALYQGLCSINGTPSGPRQVFRNNDHIVNKVHRHEPPVTAEPIRVLYRNDQEGRLVVVKPGSIPVHSAGRYHHNTLLEMLKHDHGLAKVFTSNRLDRLTSGVMVLSITPSAAQALAKEYRAGKVRKYYVARVQGQFPSERIVCTQPILPIDAQSGVNIVHPSGRECETIFERVSYHAESNTSLVRAQPITGRTHQIRVHCQYLGYLIANDPLYGHDIWASFPADRMASESVDPGLASLAGGNGTTGSKAVDTVIAAIKKEKDSQENWSRSKDEILFSQLLASAGYDVPALPGLNARSAVPNTIGTREQILSDLGFELGSSRFMEQIRNEPIQGVCSECITPLLPDPDPESLFIFLHAYKYESDTWSYEDEFPWWAQDDWQDRLHASRLARAEAQRQGLDRSIHYEVPAKERSSPPTKSVLDKALETTEKPSSSQELTEKYLDPLASSGMSNIERQELGGLSQLRLEPGFTRLIQRNLLAPQVSEPLPPLVQCSTALTFDVFSGLEDVAEHDLRRVLGTYRNLYGLAGTDDRDGTLAFLHSGQVAVRPGSAATLLLRAWLDGRIRSAYGAHLVLSESDFPCELSNRLVNERQTLVRTHENVRRLQRQTKQKASCLMDIVGGVQARNSSGPPDQGSSDEAPGPVSKQEIDRAKLDSDLGALTLSEAQMVQVIRDSFGSEPSVARRDAVLETWRRVRVDQGSELPPLSPQNGYGTGFKVSFDRGGFQLPTLKSPSVNPYLGHSVWVWLNGPVIVAGDEGVTWPVKLKNAELTVDFRLVPNWIVGQLFASSPEPWSDEDTDKLRRIAGGPMNDAKSDPPYGAVFITLDLPEPKHVAARPELEPEVFGGGTLLRPDRAHILAGLTCLPPTPSTERIKILEPCAGWGRIPVELRHSLMEAGVNNVDLFGSDVDPDSVWTTQELLRRTQVAEGAGVRTFTHLLDATDSTSLGRWMAGLKVAETEGQARQLDLKQRANLIQSQSKSSAGNQDAHPTQAQPHEREKPSSSPPAPTSHNTSTEDSTINLAQADAIVTDLPWGHRVMTNNQLRRFYRMLLPSLLAILKPGGRAILMTAQYTLLDRVISDFIRAQAGQQPLFAGPGGRDRIRARQEWTLEKTLLALPPADTLASAHVEPSRRASNPVTYQYNSAETDDQLGVHAIGYEFSPARAQGVRNAEAHGGHRTAVAGYIVGVFELRKVRLPPLDSEPLSTTTL